jgi:hypothetical protein
VATADWVLHFKISLPPILRTQWYELTAKLNTISPNDVKDEVRWKWLNMKQFTVKLVYQQLTKDHCGQSYQVIKKTKIPLKIKIFMWMVAQRAILTKDNMLSRNWHGDPGCYFCGFVETVDHLLFQCPVAKVVWGYY